MELAKKKNESASTFSDTGTSFSYTSSESCTSISSSLILAEMETTQYYAGLPSCPSLLARTSPIPWQKPKGMEAYRRRKELRVLVNHKLNMIWETEVASQV